MDRIAKQFSYLESKNRKALITYIVAGDPSLDMTDILMHEMVASGADLLELGVPFSDPMAEGPIIQAAHERALHNSVNLTQILETVSRFREEDKDTPVVLMGYANPIERMGYEKFARAASDVGLDGVLTVDIPVEEIAVLCTIFAEVGLDSILLVAPTSSEERILRITSKANGFLYSVALTGVTGDKTLDFNQVKNQVISIRQFSDLPVVVGFGIKDAKIAKSIASVSDGVVVGSAIVDCLARSLGTSSMAIKNVTNLVSAIRLGIDLGAYDL
jgi:tryptophan synthase alpha chain